MPQLRSVCKALGLGNWLEEVLLTGKETQLEFYEFKMVAHKEEENSEPSRDPLDLSDLTSTRRSSRLQPLQCKLCDSNHYSLTSLQSHYNKCHFSPTSGRSGKGRKASKLKSEKKWNWSKSSSDEKEHFSVQTTTNALLSDIGSGTGKQCKVHLTNLRNRDEVSIEVLGKREGLRLQLSKLAKGRNAVELGDLLKEGADLSVEVSSKSKKTAGFTQNAEAQDEHDGHDPNNNSTNDNQCDKEELFFPLWNKFLTNKVVPGPGRLRQHLPFALKTFFLCQCVSDQATGSQQPGGDAALV